MARVNKNSRIKGLPPRILLQEKDAEFYHYVENNTGVTQSIKWDDENTITFSSSMNVSFGTNVPTDFYDKSFYNDSDFITYFTGSNNVTVKTEFVENIISFNSKTLLPPFNETDHYDLKTESVNEKLTGSYYKNFYNSGSTVDEVASEFFNQPLSSKTKFVVDITPNNSCTLSVKNFTSSSTNHVMCYWNNDQKTWEAIGGCKEFSHSDYYHLSGANSGTIRTAYQKFLNEAPIGFGFTAQYHPFDYHSINTPPSFVNSKIIKNTGAPISDFLFPVHSKFQATSSNLIKMSDYIKRPFLLEKVIVETSATFNSNRMAGSWGVNPFSGYAPGASICTFFLLNQINGVNEEYSTTVDVFSGNVLIPVTITSSTRNNSYTTRELITWGGVGGFSTYGVSFSQPSASFVENLTRLIYSGAVIFGSSTVVLGISRGEYFDGDGKSFAEYADNNGITYWPSIASMADKVSGLENKETKIYARKKTDTTYRSEHPEFNSIVGPFGISGQSNSADLWPHRHASWTKDFSIPMKTKSPLKKNNLYFMSLYDYGQNTSSSDAEMPSCSIGFMLNNDFAGRRFNNKTYGRELKNTLKDPGFPPLEPSADVSLAKIFLGKREQTIYGYNEQSMVSPYLLLPSDNLIFGWQLPLPSVLVRSFDAANPGGVAHEFNHTLGAELIFASKESKITFYGSYITEGKENNDTLKQPLFSNTIHQIIGDE